METQPDAVIWNTDQRGKRPDILRLAYAAYLESEGRGRTLHLKRPGEPLALPRFVIGEISAGQPSR